MGTDNIFPDNWKEVIQGKKVIFYNTGVSGLLHGREKQIEKMKRVFDVFQKHPEVVLWWRPHPLELGTIESMAPELAQEYVEMRKEYKDKNMGILDESTDLHRAIAISDAYYGDWSSVIHLYRAVKKPVLTENINIKDMRDALFLPGTVCIKDQYIWFLQLNSNKLVKVNRTTFEVEDIISIPMEKPYKHRMNKYHIIDAGSKLLLLLGNSKNIYEYEIETQIIGVYSLNAEMFGFHSEIVIKKDNKLLLFPYGDNKVWEYDYSSGIFTDKKHMGRKGVKAAGCYEIVDKDIYMVDSGSNRIYKYDVVNNSYIDIQVGDEKNKYWGIKKAGEYFILPHMDKKIVTLWNEETGEIADIVDFPEYYACISGSAYLNMFEENGDMYIFPYYANMILKVDVQNRLITQEFTNAFFEADYELDSESLSDAMYLCAKRYGDSIYAYALHKSCWQILDINSTSIQDGPVFDIKSTEHKKLLETLLDSETNNEEPFCEGESSVICTLDNYIRNVADNSLQRCDSQLYGNCIGANIHKLIASEA